MRLSVADSIVKQPGSPERHRPAALRRRNETERDAVGDAAQRQLAIVAGVDCGGDIMKTEKDE